MLLSYIADVKSKQHIIFFDFFFPLQSTDFVSSFHIK